MARRHDIAGLLRDRAFRVRAESLEDLEIVSSMLQDAIVPISEIAYQRQDKRFALMTQRFRWETSEVPTEINDAATIQEALNDNSSGSSATTGRSYERVLCALRIENVTAVQTNGIDLSKRGQMLELLSLHVADGVLHLAFADSKTIRLSTMPLSCHAEDIGEAWPTTLHPEHPDDE
jgi:hypothetical protein